MNNPVFGIKQKYDRLTDLDFADDIALLSGAHSSPVHHNKITRAGNKVESMHQL